MIVCRRAPSSIVALLTSVVAGCGASIVVPVSSDVSPPSAQTTTVTVQPATVQVPAKGAVRFSAEVYGSADCQLTWRVAEQGGGEIDAAGHYIAPELPGEYHVIATSKQQPGVAAVATVSVIGSVVTTASSPAVAPPTITSFSAAPATLTAGQSTALSWSTTNADTVEVSPGPGVVTSTPATVTPTTTTTYTLTARNGTAASTATITVTVLPSSPPPDPSAPSVSWFSASPDRFQAGGSATLSWSVSNASSVTITPDVGAVAGDAAIVSPSVTTTYVLTARNSAGATTAMATVTVVPAPAPAAPAAPAAPTAPAVAASGGFGTGGTGRPGYVNVTGGGPKPSASDGVSVTSYGARGDGSTDDTAAFQQAAYAARDRGRPLVVPATSSSYRLTSRVTLFGSIIGVDYPLVRMTESTGSSETIVFQTSYTGPGMWITGLRIDGGYDPTGQTTPGGDYNNQHSHVISLASARNVTVEDNLIRNAAGDLIYLGSSTDSAGPSRNILINGNSLINPFRNGIGFTFTDGIVVTNNVLIKLNTFVLAYDIEPNNSVETNYNIEIAYNQDSIPTHILNTVGVCEYANVADINCLAAGGDFWFHDETVFPGGTIDGESFGPGSFGERWYRGTSCSNYSTINVDSSLR